MLLLCSAAAKEEFSELFVRRRLWLCHLLELYCHLLFLDLAVNFPLEARLYFLFFFNLPRNPDFLLIFGSVTAETGQFEMT